MKIDATISISRTNNDDVRITITDEASRSEFFSGRMSLNDFAKAVTGQGYMPCPGEVRGIENIGKIREQRAASIYCPKSHSACKEDVSSWLKEHGGEDGWIVDPYLGSQSSVSSEGEGLRLRYTLYRFVDISGEPE